MRPDVDRVLDLLAAIGTADADRLIILTIDGEPKSKARARVVRGHAYTPASTAEAQQALAWHFRARISEPFTGNVALVALFYRPNHQRIDSDNLMKLVLDAATQAGAWKDDCQVTAQLGIVELDQERPRTVIGMCPIVSTLQRGVVIRACPRCGGPFSVTTPQQARKYCSPACAQPRAIARCPKCGIEFHRRSAGQRYCSRECGRASPLVRQPRWRQRSKPTCQSCGGPVSRREYVRCVNCAPKGRKLGSKNKPKAAGA